MGSTNGAGKQAHVASILDRNYEYFDISESTGFLDNEHLAYEIPADLPEKIWESVLLAGKGLSLHVEGQSVSTNELNSVQAWRKLVHQVCRNVWRSIAQQLMAAQLDVIDHLSPRITGEKGLLRRCYVVLCMLGQIYMHAVRDSCQEKDENHTTVPHSIAVPWLLVSESLGVKPVISYCSAILWNSKIPDLSRPSADLIEILETFTDHPSEVAFYVGASRVELEGAPIIRAIFDTFAIHLRGSDVNTACVAITKELANVHDALLKMTGHLRTQLREVDGHHFYWELRPWIAGTPPEGWRYDLGNGNSKTLHLGGATAGSAALLQALDSFLGVNFAQVQRQFRVKMQEYMPRGHRTFVQTVDAIRARDVLSPYLSEQMEKDTNGDNHILRTLIEYITAIPEHKIEAGDMLARYNDVLHMLDEFRGIHFQIVTRFIINQARKGRSGAATASEDVPLKGTGGSDLAKLLKGYRKASAEAVMAGAPTKR